MAKATEYLGGDWRTAALDLSMMVPGAYQWDGGGRWFRCDLTERASSGYGDVVYRVTSLKGAFASATPPTRGCYRASAGSDNRMDFGAGVPCDQAHEAEFAGVYTAPDGPFPIDDAANAQAASAGCRSVVAAFTGLPNDASLPYRVVSIYDLFRKGQWQLGDRSVACHTWSQQPVNRSFKGAGPAVLPMR